MKPSTFFKTLGFSLLFSVFTLLGAQAQMSAQWADTLNKVLQQCRMDENMKGAASAVVFADGSVWSGQSGHYGFSPLQSGLLYDIGSNTKTMVATITLLLEEEGLLSIDDPLSDYLSTAYPNVPGNVTLKQLLGHNSGIFNYTNHPNFGPEITDDFNVFWHPDTILNSFVAAPLFTPGANYSYSNTNYVLLGKVIEVVEQKPLHVVMRDRLFDPLQLSNTFLEAYDAHGMTLTGTWSGNQYVGDYHTSLLSSAWAAGGIVATPEDLATWAHKLYSGEVLTAASMDKMRTGPTSCSTTLGLGLFEETYKGRVYLGHGGTTFQNSQMHYSLDSDFSLVVMNIDNGLHDETERMFLKLTDVLEYIQQVVSAPELAKATATVKVYPNPSSNIMTVQLEQATNPVETHLELRDVTGRLVAQQTFLNHTTTLEKSSFGAGIYLLNLVQNGQLVESRKVIFQ